MTLKTSFCDTSIIKSNVKKLLPICFLHTLVILLTFIYWIAKDFADTSPVIQTYLSYTFGAQDIYIRFISTFISSFIFPMISAVVIFSYLHSKAKATFYHSLPILRRTLYISNYISGVISFLLPIIINLCIMLFLRFNPNPATTYQLSQLMMIFLTSILCSFFVFSCGAFVSMIATSTLSAALLSCLLAALPFIAEYLSVFLSTGKHEMQQHIYLNPSNLHIFKAFIYIAIATLFTIAANFIYKLKRFKHHISIICYLAAAILLIVIALF